MTKAYLNRVATAVPKYEVHQTFIQFVRGVLGESRLGAVFERMVDKSQIEQRYSVMEPAADASQGVVDAAGRFRRGNFPTTAERMRIFEAAAPDLSIDAIGGLGLSRSEIGGITHIVVTSCTGLYAPGIDLQLIDAIGLRPSVERTMISFMGCYAAINALKVARHIVRSEPDSRVLMLNLELCTLHLQETQELEPLLSYLVFADGCAASLITAEPQGAALEHFRAILVPETQGHITWRIDELGFDMFLSGAVPGSIGRALRTVTPDILHGWAQDSIDLWAIHPGGRSVLDSVEDALHLPPASLDASRSVLRRFGNMSSPTIMFVMKELLAKALPGQKGCAMAFGPGLTAETLLFETV